MRLDYAVGAVIIFGLLVGLLALGYSGLTSNYDYPVEERVIDGVMTNQTVIDKLNTLNFVEGVDQIANAFKQTTSGSIADIFGAGIAAALGFIKTIAGIFSVPFEIGAILEDYYNLPPLVLRYLLIIMAVGIAFAIWRFQAGRTEGA